MRMSTITVMNPQLADDREILKLAPQIAQLKNARVAFVDNSKVNADLFLSRVRPMLENIYGIKSGVTIRKLAPKDELTDDDLRQLADHDAVIQCFGDCGTSTSISVFDGVRLERLGIPTATVCSNAGVQESRTHRRNRIHAIPRSTNKSWRTPLPTHYVARRLFGFNSCRTRC